MLDFDENSAEAPDWYEDFEKALGIENNDEALRLAKDAVAYCKEDFDEAGEAIAYCGVARASLARGDAKGAKRACDQALQAAKDSSDSKAEAAALHALAKLGEPESAAKAEEALEAYRSLDDKAGEAAVMITMAQMHRKSGDFDEAMDTTKQALQILENLGSAKGQASALYVQCLIQLCLGRVREAHSTLNDMLRLYTDVGDEVGTSNVQLISAQLLLSQGRAGQAMDSAQIVSATAEALGDWKKKATAVYLMAKLHAAEARAATNPGVAASEGDKAFEHAEAAWSLFREVRDKAGQAAALSLIAEFTISKGDIGSAALKFEEVAFLQRSLKDTLEEARALKKLAEAQLKLCTERHGTITISQGDVYDPQKNARRAVELFQQVGRAGERELPQAFLSLGRVQSMMGETEKALESFKTSQKSAYELGDDSNEASAWLQQAKLLLAMGLRGDALELAEKAAGLAEGLNAEVANGAKDLITQNSKQKREKAGPVAGPKANLYLQIYKTKYFTVQEQEARIARHMTQDNTASSSSALEVGLKLEDIIAPKDSNVMYNMKWSESVQVAAPKSLDQIVA